MSEIDKRKEYGQRRAVWLRNYQRARSRALTKLAQQNPDQYKELLEKERLADEANGRAWLDITGTTANDLNTGASGNARDNSPRPTQTNPDNE
jgi:hypothetical protein